ncbi:translation initiation factor eIF 4e-like domain-containing protein [Melampsora americana]|nr:translation initiation factor eIF 4e-like domain-containing protein [Melampsora americana]
MKTLPLRDSWRLFFSDTSPTSTTSSGNKTPSSSNRSSYLKASEYQSGMSIVFKEINTVESLCESLVGLKRFIGSKCRGYEWLEGPGKGIGLVAFKAQQNLHFFKTGVSPVWEDPWNNKGGRLTISLSLLTLDPIFESLILLIAGGVIETDTGNGGRIVGIVGSRRSRGDRIEIWLSGLKQNEPPNEVWIKKVIECLVREIGNEFKGVKFKRHL